MEWLSEPKIKITGYDGVSNDGLQLKFSRPVRIGNGGQYSQGKLKLNEWWVSWDKLSEMIAPFMDTINKED